MADKKLNHEDEEAKQIIKRFCDMVFWLKDVHYIFHELVDEEDSRRLLERTAHTFFLDINNIVADCFLLEVAKLSDPATSSVGKRENFTLDNLVETILWPDEYEKRIRKQKDTVQSFRQDINEARNRLLAHYDKSLIMNGDVLGSFTEGKDREVMKALEEICDLMHHAAFGVIYGEMVPQCSGDVLDLRKYLLMGLAFEELFSNSEGDDLARLNELLEKV